MFNTVPSSVALISAAGVSPPEDLAEDLDELDDELLELPPQPHIVSDIASTNTSATILLIFFTKNPPLKCCFGVQFCEHTIFN
jgi:hypothetical protein